MTLSGVVGLLSNSGAAAVLGASVGGLFSFGATYYFTHRQRATQRNRLKSAFISEINAMKPERIEDKIGTRGVEDIIDSYRRIDEDPNIDYEFGNRIEQEAKIEAVKRAETRSMMDASTKVFDNNLDKIGLLNEKEIAALMHLYRIVELIEEEMAAVVDTVDKESKTIDEERFQEIRGALIQKLD